MTSKRGKAPDVRQRAESDPAKARVMQLCAKLLISAVTEVSSFLAAPAAGSAPDTPSALSEADLVMLLATIRLADKTGAHGCGLAGLPLRPDWLQT